MAEEKPDDPEIEMRRDGLNNELETNELDAPDTWNIGGKHINYFILFKSSQQTL